MRYAAIVLCALLALAWTPSHANALPREQTGAGPQVAPQSLIQMHQANIIWAMGFPLPSFYLLPTRNSPTRRVARD
jgi:hypothetical protein